MIRTRSTYLLCLQHSVVCNAVHFSVLNHSIQGKKKVVAAALGFGPGWQQLGLPHPVPIACVGCGSCDTELLEAISKITNGMYSHSVMALFT